MVTQRGKESVSDRVSTIAALPEGCSERETGVRDIDVAIGVAKPRVTFPWSIKRRAVGLWRSLWRWWPG